MTITVSGLGKTYGNVRAVDDLSFTVQPGHVTGFLGPNGAGKSTAMRLMLGLDSGDGQTLFNGQQLKDAPHATKVVGAHLDAKVFHPQRTARQHLRMLGSDARLSNARVDQVISMVGLGEVANKRPKGFSLGMAQRLGLAGAILADPYALMLDEPANGLDPQSIAWLREFLRYYASQGRCVLVSSHLLTEMQLMADHVVVIARGKMIADNTIEGLVDSSTLGTVLIRSNNRLALSSLLHAEGINATLEGEDGLSIHGLDTDRIGDAAFRAGVMVRELTARRASLEEAFFELTGDKQQFAFDPKNAPGNTKGGAA